MQITPDSSPSLLFSYLLKTISPSNFSHTSKTISNYLSRRPSVYVTEGADQYAIVPFTAGGNFISQATYYIWGYKRVRPRSWFDCGHLAVAAAFMLTAYHLQLHDNSTYCFSPHSPFQAHAAVSR